MAQEGQPDKRLEELEKRQEAQEKLKEIAEAYKILKANSMEDLELSVLSKSKSGHNLAEIYYEQGIEYYEDERYKEAIYEFTQAIRFDSNHIKSYQYRGFILDKLGFQQIAKADFQKVQELKANQTARQDYNSTVSNRNVFFIKDDSPITALAILEEIGSPHNIDHNINFLVTGHKNSAINLWSLKSKEKVEISAGKYGAICFLILTNDQNTLITTEDKDICLWNLTTSEQKVLGEEKDRHLEKILALAISPDNQSLVSASADRTIKVWNLISRPNPFTIASYAHEITAVAINPKLPLFAVGGLENNLRIRSLKDGKLIKSISLNSAVRSVAFSPDGQLIAVGEFNHNIEIYNIQTRQRVGLLKGHFDVVSSLIFTADGQQIISASWDRTIKIWSVSHQEIVSTLKGHQEAISTVAITTDQRIIVSGSSDGKIGIWNL